MSSVVYDARPLKPETRHWGVGEFIENLLPEIHKKHTVRGLSHSFASSDVLNIDTWPSLAPVDKLIYEFSPLFTGQFDVYWGTNTFIPGFFLNHPSIVTVHDMILFDLPGDQRGSKYFQHRFIMALKKTRKILTVSQTTADSLIQMFPEVKNKVEAILSGYSLKGLEVPADNAGQGNKSEPYVIMLGAPRVRKRLDLAIQAVKNINQSGTRLKLIVTGNIHSEFNSLVNENRGFVKTTGVLGKTDQLSMLRGARALLFPTTYEGFGFPVLEAMSMECPVIASDIPVIREVSGGAANLVSGDHENWTRAVKKVLSERNYREDLISAAKINLQRFSWEKTGEVYNSVISSVAA